MTGRLRSGWVVQPEVRATRVNASDATVPLTPQISLWIRGVLYWALFFSSLGMLN